MLDHEAELHLGIEGYPAERGLYETLLQRTGLHRQDADGSWRFLPPDCNGTNAFISLWAKTRQLFKDSGTRVVTAEHPRNLGRPSPWAEERRDAGCLYCLLACPQG